MPSNDNNDSKFTYDTILIGAGPIGLETAAVLARAGINYVHLEAGALGESIRRWPRNTRFFSSPEWITLAGVPMQTERQETPTGEQYLAYMRSIVETLGLVVRTYEPVTEISGKKRDFRVVTRDLARRSHEYRGRTIILATGDMNEPRRLNVPGEELPHVTHYWRDPHDYFQRRLLIVGGRNSALEAAVRCWRAGVDVTLSYRRKTIDENRTLSRLYLDAQLLIRNGKIRFLPESSPREFRPGVTIMEDGSRVETDFVYLATGFQMDLSLYRQLGVELIGPELRPLLDENTMESSVPGVYVVGTATAGTQSRFTTFITTSHNHCLRAARAIAPERTVEDGWVGNYPPRNYSLSSGDIE